jgi:hypothetical protein
MKDNEKSLFLILQALCENWFELRKWEKKTVFDLWTFAFGSISLSETWKALAPLTSVEVTTIVSPIVIESPDANFPLNKKEKKNKASRTENTWSLLIASYLV